MQCVQGRMRLACAVAVALEWYLRKSHPLAGALNTRYWSSHLQPSRGSQSLQFQSWHVSWLTTLILEVHGNARSHTPSNSSVCHYCRSPSAMQNRVRAGAQKSPRRGVMYKAPMKYTTSKSLGTGYRRDLSKSSKSLLMTGSHLL